MTAQGGPGRLCPTCREHFADEVLFCPRDGCSQPLSGEDGRVADPYVGRLIAGQFRVERLLGAGATARVYLALETGRERRVALKILRHELRHDEAANARIRREASIGAQLRHPNLAEVLLLGAVDASDGRPGGEPFLVLEYLDGISLTSALIAQGGALGLQRAAHVVLQLSDALGEAHAHGVVHRDLKPDNVLLLQRGEDADFVKVLDFGMARAGHDPSFATRDGAVLGTARYMAPEAAQGLAVGPAGDVYALATLLFECITGSTPFDGKSAVSILLQQISAPPPDLCALGPGHEAPPALAQLVAKNLAKNPLERAPNARAFGAELSACVHAGRRPQATPSRLVGSPTS